MFITTSPLDLNRSGDREFLNALMQAAKLSGRSPHLINLKFYKSECLSSSSAECLLKVLHWIMSRGRDLKFVNALTQAANPCERNLVERAASTS